MKNFSLTALYALLFTLLFSCDPNTCRDIQCGEFGICEEGECFCEDYYEKDDNGLCNTLMREKVLGDWTSPNSCALTVTDSIHIEAASTDLGSININDLNSFSNSITASISETDLTIERQSPDNNSIFIEGSGEYDVDTETISWELIISDESQNPIVIDSCTAVWE
jgi:hypothetical protein